MTSATPGIEAAVRQWLERVVVGLNLCPFAAHPLREGRVRIVVSTARRELDLLTELQFELQHLENVTAATCETTLIAIPQLLETFADYNDFLDDVDRLLTEFGWDGDYQVASFHPDYQFADTRPDDAENLTNRSPVPILHLLREASVEAAITGLPDPDEIPQRNIRRMRELSAEQRRSLFGWISDRAEGQG